MNSFEVSNLTVVRNARPSAKIAGLLLIACVSVPLAACKGRGATPGTNVSPVSDALPQNSYADVVSRVAPAVVTIRADKRVRRPEQYRFFDDPFFRGLFGEREQRQQPRESLERALGSGVIVSADGYIITNHHVVDGAEQIKIDLSDGRTIDAKLVGSDPPSDLVAQSYSNGLVYLTPGDSDKVRTGDVRAAIGILRRGPNSDDGNHQR